MEVLASVLRKFQITHATLGINNSAINQNKLQLIRGVGHQISWPGAHIWFITSIPKYKFDKKEKIIGITTGHIAFWTIRLSAVSPTLSYHCFIDSYMRDYVSHKIMNSYSHTSLFFFLPGNLALKKNQTKGSWKSNKKKKACIYDVACLLKNFICSIS